MSWYYYWNVLTVELRTIMLQDVTRIKYAKGKKDKKDENVTVVNSIDEIFK